ncbi:MAG: carboxypeptidase-like regulatory domain-containing protein [Planctomycetaceae bacterium]
MMNRLLALSLCLVMAGCGGASGPDIASVEGTVTMDGQPLANASVVFIPENGRPGGAWTDSSGHYVLNFSGERQGAIPGKNTVRISTYREGGQNEDGTMAESQKETVPAKYNAQSELTFTVEDGKANVADFAITSEGALPEVSAEN